MKVLEPFGATVSEQTKAAAGDSADWVVARPGWRSASWPTGRRTAPSFSRCCKSASPTSTTSGR